MVSFVMLKGEKWPKAVEMLCFLKTLLQAYHWRYSYRAGAVMHTVHFFTTFFIFIFRFKLEINLKLSVRSSRVISHI
jgi:hypothetical protein